ncbi:hypothetical protein CXF68_15900 [Tenacibaculum sp. Bg11-29]|uniref:tetratricopeptide repeat protein n=1 Tax=Tenacibaculum sp. Bg11-29 TaxID=2058306 RepID=UPI000C34D1C2|nr:sel1 repeat family protein [Tenacibaculum sp. Bg11-29]PKH52086.1 hypothetical protein CXF68_15900 [Tenacibaculum sp. Bg11-29]
MKLLKKTNFYLLILFLSFQQLHSQNKCFTEKTVKFHKESKHKEKIFNWLIEAAEANYAYAIHDLGLLYVRGNNKTPINFKKAYNYFEKSAYLGIHNSMRSLGILWQYGDGRKVNLSKAYAWYKLAGDFVPTNWDEWHMPRSKVFMFKKLAPNLARKMTPKQIKYGKKYYKKIKSKVKCNFNLWINKNIKNRN